MPKLFLFERCGVVGHDEVYYEVYPCVTDHQIGVPSISTLKIVRTCFIQSIFVLHHEWGGLILHGLNWTP